MRRVPYSDVLAQTALLYTGSATVTTEIGAGLRIWINRAAREFWRSAFWPEWTHLEQRYFAPLWNIEEEYLEYSTATNPFWVYYPPTLLYYQALTTPQLLLTPPEDETIWVPADASYSGDYIDTSESYTIGDVVQSPWNNRFYQAFIDNPSIPLASADPIDTGWGVLTPFVRRVAYDQADQLSIDVVAGVYETDPALDPATPMIRWDMDATGVLPYTTADSVWIKFRQAPPSWSGAVWDAATTYAVDDQVWSASERDYFRSVVDGNLNQAVTNNSYWERVDFPLVLRDAVAETASAAAKRTDGDTDAAWTAALSTGMASIRREIAEFANRQTNVGRMSVPC